MFFVRNFINGIINIIVYFNQKKICLRLWTEKKTLDVKSKNVFYYDPNVQVLSHHGNNNMNLRFY